MSNTNSSLSSTENIERGDWNLEKFDQRISFDQIDQGTGISLFQNWCYDPRLENHALGLLADDKGDYESSLIWYKKITGDVYKNIEIRWS
jgi:hypothetical protein